MKKNKNSLFLNMLRFFSYNDYYMISISGNGNINFFPSFK